MVFSIVLILIGYLIEWKRAWTVQPLLQQYYHWLNSAAFLQLLRDISGDPSIV